MNNFLVLGILLVAFLACFETNSFAQQTNTGEEEEAIDLDSLKEEEGKPHDGESNKDEALLTVDAEPVEMERHPALALGALALLVPVAALLLPMNR